MSKQKQQRDHAVRCIDTLTENFHLCPEIKELFCAGEIPVSVSITYLDFAMIRSVSQNWEFQMIIQDFEMKFDACVYCCIPNSNMLTMLYVGRNEKDWDFLSPRLGDKQVWAAVYNWDFETLDFGYVSLEGNLGVLTRIA